MNWIGFLFKIFTAAFIILLSCSPTNKAFASYAATEGRISYLAGMLVNTNFQENLFNNNDSQAKLGRSQSFALLLQALGDINSESSLMAEVTLGTHKFCKEKESYLDEYMLEAISFDLGYRRNVSGDFWMSMQIGSLYPWRVNQRVRSQPLPRDESEFKSLYSLILGLQYESELFSRPVSYNFRIQKYMSAQIDDQMALGFSIGWRFGT